MKHRNVGQTVMLCLRYRCLSVILDHPVQQFASLPALPAHRQRQLAWIPPVCQRQMQRMSKSADLQPELTFISEANMLVHRSHDRQNTFCARSQRV